MKIRSSPARYGLAALFIGLAFGASCQAQDGSLPDPPRPSSDLRAELSPKLSPALLSAFHRYGVPGEATATAQVLPPAPALQIVILEGENVLNNIRDRTAREPIVQVQDENHKPVAGASVTFTVQTGSSHAGAAFAHGVSTFTGQTDANGRLIAHGFRPNAHVGQFHVAVSASKGNLVTHAVFIQQNVVTATAVSAGSGITGVVASHVVLVTAVTSGVVAGAVATGVVLTRNNTTSITSGTGSVGAPNPAFSLKIGGFRH